MDGDVGVHPGAGTRHVSGETPRGRRRENPTQDIIKGSRDVRLFTVLYPPNFVVFQQDNISLRASEFSSTTVPTWAGLRPLLGRNGEGPWTTPVVGRCKEPTVYEVASHRRQPGTTRRTHRDMGVDRKRRSGEREEYSCGRCDLFPGGVNSHWSRIEPM